MKTTYLSYEEQLLIVEDLYNITDSLEAARRLEQEYGIKLVPGRSLELNDFARMLDKTNFYNWDIEKAIARQSGHKIRLRDL